MSTGAAGAVVAPLLIWLPMPPNLGNTTFSHPMTKARARRAYWRELDKRKGGYHIPRPPAAPFARARADVTYHLKSRRYVMDRDNRYHRLKFALDWLVTEKYLAGDTDRHLDLPDPAQVVGLDGVPALCSVRLILTPLPPIPA